MNKPLTLETEHLSPYRPCWGNMVGAPLPGTLRPLFFTYIIGFLFLDPEDLANLSCGTEEKTSVPMLCECEALASLRHAYVGSLILDS